jgi:hypothetical protein
MKKLIKNKDRLGSEFWTQATKIGDIATGIL